MGEEFGTIRTLGEWAAHVRQRSAPKYLIHNILPADNLVLLSGVPKDAQKTFLAMTAALIVATGKAVGNLRPPAPCKVLYIYEEGDQPGTLARFDALAAGHGFGSVEDIHNIHFAHREGFSLENADYMKQVGAMVARENIKFVIIDTLAKCMQGDENNVQAVSAAIRATNVFRKQACSVMFVHHTRKEDSRLSNKSYGTPEPDYDIRGSSALCGAYETHWAVRTYNTGLEGEPERYLMVGGKEFAWKAFHYKFNFSNETFEGDYGPEERMTHCALQLNALMDMPYVEAKQARSKKKEEL